MTIVRLQSPSLLQQLHFVQQQMFEFLRIEPA